MNLVRFEKVSNIMYEIYDEYGYVGFLRFEDGWILITDTTVSYRYSFPENTIREIYHFIITH